jgi:CheY-like chemotaxis protein
VLVCDLRIPTQDGYHLIRQIRAKPADRGGKIPALALTAYAMEEDRDRALAAGFQMHLSKPIDAVELVTYIANLVGRSQPDQDSL